MTDPFSVPTAAPHPAAHPPVERVRSVRGLAVALTTLFGAIGVVLLVNAIGLFARAAWVDRVLSGAAADPDAADTLDGVVLGTTVLSTVLTVVLAVLFITWQYRHAKNARLLGQQGGLGPGWAIGGWFIPLANFVLPAVQLFGASGMSATGPDGSRTGRGAPIVIPWMVAFALGNLLTQAAVIGMPAETDPGYGEWLVTSDRTEAMGSIVLIAAAVLAVIMVRSLTKRQEATLSLARPAPAYPSTGHAAPAAWQQPPAGIVDQRPAAEADLPPRGSVPPPV